MQIGTLRELNVQPGDVVRLWDGAVYSEGGGPWTVISAEVLQTGSIFDGQVSANLTGYGRGIFDTEKFTLISRAKGLWRDMSQEQKGALMLAHHENPGSVEVFLDKEWVVLEHLGWMPNYAYRIKPQEEDKPHTPIWGFYEEEYPIFTDADSMHPELSEPVTPAVLNRLVDMLKARDAEILRLQSQ